MIPKILHEVYIGEIPAREAEFCQRMEALNPDFTYKLHRDELLEKHCRDPYVRQMISQNEPMAFVVDRLRVLLLREEGGIYVDADAEPVNPFSSIDHILNDPKVDFVTGLRNPWRPGVALHRQIPIVDNTIMLSAKNGRMVNRLCNLYTARSVIQTGHSHGIEILRTADETTVLLNYRFFYDDTKTSEAIILHDDRNLSSWITRRPTLAAV